MKRPLRYLSWIVTIPLGIIVISFAVSNREPVALGLWPLPFEVEMPLFLPVLGALVVGFVTGGAIAWWSGGRTRRLARRQSSRLKSLTSEVETLRSRDEESSDSATRKREAERLSAAAHASEVAAQREASPAPRRLAPVDGR